MYQARKMWVSQVTGFFAMVEIITSPSAFTAFERWLMNALGLSTCSMTSIEVTTSNSFTQLCSSSRCCYSVLLKYFSFSSYFPNFALCSTASLNELLFGSSPVTLAPNLVRLFVKNPAPHPTSRISKLLKGLLRSLFLYFLMQLLRNRTRSQLYLQRICMGPLGCHHSLIWSNCFIQSLFRVEKLLRNNLFAVLKALMEIL